MATQWTHDLFRAIDRMDSRAFAGFLAEDAVFRFGNMPEVKGRGAITTAVEQFFSSIRGLRHRILHAWEQGSHVIVQGEVTYTRKDGKVLGSTDSLFAVKICIDTPRSPRSGCRKLASGQGRPPADLWAVSVITLVSWCCPFLSCL
ncbi:MAG: hypothetical protein QT04_C0060G0012 [archaeon GW2011_AR11]|nr:MAG: hypothetical protein QT04_C0060G0012 [archaeon GW2011_AR11]